MCSICAMVDFDNPAALDGATLEKMGGTMQHRGPDQSGTFFDTYVAFQHNRLSVIDPANGRQPMTRSLDGNRCTIIYNGEIYNAPELRRELAALGAQFETACDTEVVLYAYLAYGSGCARCLNGIFAFAVWDEARQSVYLCRDRLGVKPLFYAQSSTTFLLGSEIKSLLAHPGVEPVVDFRGLWQLLYLSPISLLDSGIFRDIHQVMPGYHGYYSRDGLKLEPYWRLEARPCTDSREEILEHTRFLVSDAIKRQLVSDVPLCTFLSGGLDSSVITAAAAREYEKRGMQLGTYSFEYEGNKRYFHSTLFQPQGDDEYAVYLADILGTDHEVLTACTAEVAGALPASVSARDFPGQADIDSSLLCFCRMVKKRHTVALSGECSDEIFGGYPWFYRPEMLSNPFFPWVHDPMRRVGLFDDAAVRSKEGYDYLSGEYRDILANCPLLDGDSPIMRQSRQATWLSVRYFMTSLLERKDRMSMASAIEVRVPFADHRILEYVYNIPWEIKYEDGVEKALLRNAVADWLPERILHRKKSPYPKTHNPAYEALVLSNLKERLAAPSSKLRDLLNMQAFESFLQSENSTWLGQLMSRPQMLAWLIQMDEWLTSYHVQLCT